MDEWLASDACTDEAEDGWPLCPTCDADSLRPFVEGVSAIGRPFSSEEAMAYGLQCRACGQCVDGFRVNVFHYVN